MAARCRHLGSGSLLPCPEREELREGSLGKGNPVDNALTATLMRTPGKSIIP
jgi:hypothetical protein